MPLNAILPTSRRGTLRRCTTPVTGPSKGGAADEGTIATKKNAHAQEKDDRHALPGPHAPFVPIQIPDRVTLPESQTPFHHNRPRNRTPEKNEAEKIILLGKREGRLCVVYRLGMDVRVSCASLLLFPPGNSGAHEKRATLCAKIPRFLATGRRLNI